MQKQPLKKKQRLHNAFPNEVPNSRYTETAWPTWACAHLLETNDCYKVNYSIMDPDALENQHLYVVNWIKLHFNHIN